MYDEIDNETIGRFLGALRISIPYDEAARILQAADLVPRNRVKAWIQSCGEANTFAEQAEARAERLEKALQFYISRCCQPHESVNAYYERLAEEFHSKTGLTAPGKSLPVEMEALRDREKEIEAWQKFINEPLENAREALAQQDATPQATCPLCDGSDLLCLDCAWLRAEAGEESGGDHER